jgi:ATP-dependent protease HslVU (ClpYQ) peptidase subunit
MGQLLRHALAIPPHHPSIDVDKYMATTFIDAVRECLKTHGWASKKHETEEGGHFLVAYQGYLFCVESDYQVGRSVDRYMALGCGEDLARGALFALAVSDTLSGHDRVERALLAAERFSAGVCGPFCIEVLTA